MALDALTWRFSWIVLTLVSPFLLNLSIFLVDFYGSHFVVHEFTGFVNDLSLGVGSDRGALSTLSLELPAVTVFGDVIVLHVNLAYGR